MSEKRMTWEQMVKDYPDQWVIVRNAVMDGPDIVSGILVAVKPDAEILSYRAGQRKKGFVFRRTTEEVTSGILD